MALIRISGSQVWKCGRQVFESLLHDLYERLAPTRVELARMVALVVDSRLPWWSLESLDAEDFRALLAAAQATHQAWADRGPTTLADLDAYSGRLSCLKDFVLLLLRDERAGRP